MHRSIVYLIVGHSPLLLCNCVNLLDWTWSSFHLVCVTFGDSRMRNMIRNWWICGLQKVRELIKDE